MSEEIKNMIHDYAKGNQQLEIFLRTCFYKGIHSIGCNPGDKVHLPYIFFEYDNDYADKTKEFIHFILTEAAGGIEGSKIQYSSSDDGVNINIVFPNEEVSGVFYMVLANTKVPYGLAAPERLSTFMETVSLLDEYGMRSKLEIEGDTSYLSVYPRGIKLEYNKNACPSLDEYVDYLSDGNQLLPNSACSCDINSLKRFNNFLQDQKGDGAHNTKK